MGEKEKTKEQLIGELQRLRQRVAELQQSEKQRERTEAELTGAKEFVETVLNSMDDVISILDIRDFRILGVNRPFLEAVGMTEEEVLGKPCYEITHHRSDPCGPPHDICPIPEVAAGKRSSLVEHVHYDKDNRATYVEVSASPIRDEKGEVVRVVHVTRDITEPIAFEHQT